jgi:hypothetical protein
MKEGRNVARGLFRLWLVVSVLYVILMVGDIWNVSQRIGRIEWGHAAAVLLLPPIVVLAVGAAFVWAFQGFSRDA